MPRTQALTLVPKAPSRSRWKAADAKAALARLERSGLSAYRFAKLEGLNVERLYRWRRALAGGASSAPGFVEITERGVAPQIEVVLASGALVRVPRGFDDDTLRRVVSVLEATSRC